MDNATAEHDLLDLEAAIRALPGVVGCVIISHADGTPAEIQAFIAQEGQQTQVRDLIVAEVERRGLAGAALEVQVFHLGAEPLAVEEGVAEALDPDSPVALLHELAGQPVVVPGQAGGRRRPSIRRVVLSSAEGTAEAHVALSGAERDVVGLASGAKTAHGLEVLAEATLAAVRQVVGTTEGFTLRGASLIDVLERQVVLVIVEEPPGTEVVGAVLVKGPVSEAAVRATLDAVNRRLIREP